MLIILGPPGGGKGTQSRIVSEILGVKYISAGDSLKDKLKNDVNQMAKINNGQIIEDITVNDFITKLVDSIDSDSIFEGFPRTKNQCEYLLNNLDYKKVHGVIILNVKKSIILERLLKRYICANCHKPDSYIKICCGIETIKRQDDNDLAAIETRLEIFTNNIEEIKNNFVKHNIKVTYINGELSKEEVKDDIIKFYQQVMKKKHIL